MQIETYISDLLYRYDCVILPDFGAFLSHRISADIYKKSNTFYPPKKIVSFNEQIQKSDGLLAHYISDVEGISFEAANTKIALQIEHLKNALLKGETITFKNIGVLEFNSEDKVVFEPSHDVNYLTNAFGFSPFISPVIDRDVYIAQVEAIEATTPLSITPEKRHQKPYFKYAAIALIALTLGGLTASNYYVNQIEAQNEIAQEHANKQLETKIQQATFNLNTLPAVSISLNKQMGAYHIVAGAFRLESNCDKKVTELKALGFNASKIEANKYGLHQVIYDSYNTKSEAYTALAAIKKNYNNDAWILVQELH